MESSSSSTVVQEKFHAERKLFENARQCLKLGPIFRFVTSLYADRKLVVFFGVHLMSTLVIWAHFALIKFQEQKNSVPDGAPFYWLKRTVPPLEFGSMHAILFQMALIPLTMSRFCISGVLSNSPTVNLFVPVHRAVRIHIHLGYTMVTVVVLAVLLFLSFFGIICLAGDDDSFCSKFTSEIMIVGYVLLAMIVLIGGTSYFRHSKWVTYELFYAVHHLVFILYILTIVHTLDHVHRNDERKRSQAFAWFSATLLFYACDRTAMNLLRRYSAPLVSSSRVQGSSDKNGSRMVILKVLRPALFDFKPGQYALLRMKDIDAHWHPFSIASEPSSDCLEFYIEVVGKSTSWTAKLWDVLERDAPGGDIQGESYTRFELDIMGPYGTSLANMEDFSHALATGTGTGIVPALSLFKQHIRQLMLLDPTRHFAALREHERKVRKVESAQLPRKGSLAQHALSIWCCSSACKQRERQCQDPHHDPESPPCNIELREKIRSKLVIGATDNETTMEQAPVPTSKVTPSHPPNVHHSSDMELKTAAFQATSSLYGVVALSMLPVVGAALLGLTISWNTLRFDLPHSMTDYLTAFTVAFQACFGVVAVFVWDANNFLALIDVALLLVTPFADWFWVNKYKVNGTLCAREIALYCLLNGYMTFRSWAMTIRPRYRSWSGGMQSNQCGVGAAACLERFELLWSTRSSSLVAKIAPDMVRLWDDLVQAWGEENARRACKITIHVTDKDRTAVALLQQELAHTSLYRNGCIQFERPDFAQIIENQTLERIRSGQRYSYSLVAFCGAPELSQLIHQIKISNDMVTAVTGNKHHQVEFVSEHYGGLKKRVPKTRRQQQQQQQVSRDDDDGVGAAVEGDNKAALPLEYSLEEGRTSTNPKEDKSANKSVENSEIVAARLTTRKDTRYIRSSHTRQDDVEKLSVCMVEPMTGDEQWWEGVAGMSEK